MARTVSSINFKPTPPLPPAAPAAPVIKVIQTAISLGITPPNQLATPGTPGVSAFAAHEDHVHPHGAQVDPTMHALATIQVAGFMSPDHATTLNNLQVVVGYTPTQRTAFAATTDWFLSISGTTAGTGTSIGDPITPTELSRRLNGLILTVSGFMTLHYNAAGDPTGTLLITWHTPLGCQLVILGTPTLTGVSGTLTSWVSINTTSTANSYGFTDSALPTAGSWSAQVGNRIRLTSSNLCMTIIKDQNTNTSPVPKTARVAPPYLATFTYPFDTASKFVHTIPTTNSAYVVESLPSLGSVQRLGSFAPNSSVNGVNLGIIFKDIKVVDCAIDPPTGLAVAYLNCSIGLLHPIDSGQFFLLGGSCTAVDSNGGKIVAKGTAFSTGSQIGANPGATIWVQDCLIQGIILGVASGGSFRVLPGSGDGLQFFDMPATSFAFTGIALIQATISGANNATSPMAQITDGGKCAWTVLPTIPGQIFIDNIVYNSWGTGQFVDRLTGSAMFPNVLGVGPYLSAMGEVTTDQSLSNVSHTDIPGMTVTVTTVADFLLIQLTVNASTVTAAANIYLVIDGATVRGGAIPSGTNGSVNIVYRKAVTSGSHTVKAQYSTSGTLQIRPVSHVEESGAIVVQETLG